MMKKMLIAAGVSLFAFGVFAQATTPTTPAPKACGMDKCCSKVNTSDCSCKAKKAKCDAAKATADTKACADKAAANVKVEAAKTTDAVKACTDKGIADAKVDTEKAKEETKSWWKIW